MKHGRFEFSFWIRVCGRGLLIHNSRPIFSERLGYTKVTRIFGVAFEWLRAA